MVKCVGARRKRSALTVRYSANVPSLGNPKILCTRSHLQSFQTQATPLLHTEERLLDIKTANKQLNKPMKTAADYLSLAAIAAVFSYNFIVIE